MLLTCIFSPSLLQFALCKIFEEVWVLWAKMFSESGLESVVV